MYSVVEKLTRSAQKIMNFNCSENKMSDDPSMYHFNRSQILIYQSSAISKESDIDWYSGIQA